MATRGFDHLLANVTTWDDDLQAEVEDWLEARCTRDQLIKIVDRAGHGYLAPTSRPEPTKAVLALDIVEHIPPQTLLTAWHQVRQEEIEAEAAFDRLHMGDAKRTLPSASDRIHPGDVTM